jgi:putative ABC transport system substrate-binding protein
MRRRDVITGLIAAATMGRAKAQQTGKVYRIAYVSPTELITEVEEPFYKELRRLGYVEGQNLVVERFYGGGRAEHYPELARNVVRSNPDAIFAQTSRMALDIKVVTATIPIVCVSSDPVALGIAESLARPGGNITGVSADAGLEIWDKRLQLLREAVPRISRVGILASRAWSESATGAAVREAVRRAGMPLVSSPLEAPLQETEYRRVFAAMTQERADALIVGDQPENLTNQAVIVELAQEARLPAMYTYREHVESGGLIAYAFDVPEITRHAAQQIDQVLKGAKPGNIPFYQATKFELVINLKTAKALGLTIPPSLLARADEVIE